MIIKQFSTRIRDDQFTFKLDVDTNGIQRLKVEDIKGENRIKDMEGNDVTGEHLRAIASEFLTGSTI